MVDRMAICIGVLPMLMHTYGSPGLNIALVRRGLVVWEAGFGYADLAEGKPMTPETVFQSGSMGPVGQIAYHAAGSRGR